MRFFRWIKNYRTRRARRGFTLVEILITMALTASITGIMVASIMNAMTMRQKALSLNRAITLAKKKMHEIKALNKTDSGRGPFPNVPGYTFEYLIREQELDLQKIADEMGAGKMVADSAAAKFFKDRNSSTKSATGLTFKLLHFHVEVIWNEKDRYTLDYYRGLGI